MASTGDTKGQRRGSCRHIMASFDNHEKCARCREKRIGKDNFVLEKPCSLCNSFRESQKEMLSTPTYRIHKEKKNRFISLPG